MSNALSYFADLLQLDGDDIRLEQLEAEIEYLLHYNQERLLWLLYRLDVDENRLREAVSKSNIEEAKVITKMLLQRCQEIVAHRKKTGAKDKPDWSFDL